MDEGGDAVRSVFERFLRTFRTREAVANALHLAAERGDDDDEAARASAPLFYLEQLAQMRQAEQTTLYVDLAHVRQQEELLHQFIEEDFYRFEPFLRRALANVVADQHRDYLVDEERGARTFWCAFYNSNAVCRIRELTTNKIGRLTRVCGTVTRTSEVRPELLFGTFGCVQCGTEQVGVTQQHKYTEPIKCRNPVCNNTNKWTLDMSASQFVDWQRVRVQENPEEIPTGTMPRSIDVILRHEQVERAKPGDKCFFTGTLVVVPDVSKFQLGVSATVKDGRGDGGDSSGGVRGIKGTGVQELSYKLAFLASFVEPASTRHSKRLGAVGAGGGAGGGAAAAADEETDQQIADSFTDEEREEIFMMKAQPDLYGKMVSSVAPRVFGHEEIKRGILLMLFGGVHKSTIEGIRLRGDINVCVVGDPSTSKSQFLKFVADFSPRAVYTSGKSASAAGLTATVVKDADNGEFNIEAGALMLADNGVCCIDEFDKMDLKDQVAIHEAMEQQTISISKAGIQATLSARTSILAAANPIGGRYDRTKTLKGNLTIGAALMSRFDLFFVVLDECNEKTDSDIARHIVSVHQHRGRPASQAPFSTDQLRRYIRFARTVKPQLNAASEKLMVDHYRRLRQSDVASGGRTAYRITVRQLESMLRLSEALARLHLDTDIKTRYVNEAARLLRKSIIHVDADDVTLEMPAEEEAAAAAAAAAAAVAAATAAQSQDDDSGAVAKPDEFVVRDEFEFKDSLDDEDDGGGGGGGDDEGTNVEEKAVSSKRQPKKKRKRETQSLSHEQYREVCLAVVSHLRRNEAVETNGETIGALVQWRLASMRNDLTSADAVRAQTRLFRAILSNMVKRDATLLLVSEDPDNSDNNVVVVHPNFAAE